ncbi:hypothetical protein N9153_02185 [Planctomicrobium sp.]|nr:hypothetical protein [Planctomicrobium sp.]
MQTRALNCFKKKRLIRGQSNSPIVFGIIAILLLSGGFHLACVFLTGAEWEGPVSLRKPALFGISAGLTLWSLSTIADHLKMVRGMRVVRDVVAMSLLLEVALITLQFHRGVPSHFNHHTPLDTCIESAMHVLILIATACICWFTWQADQLTGLDETMVEAIQAGLWFLVVSCLIGIIITLIGIVQLEDGRSPHLLGRAGVLKYPHGATIHALQTLPALVWLMSLFRVPSAVPLIRFSIAGHVLLLAHALRQTLQGRSTTRCRHNQWHTAFVGDVFYCAPCDRHRSFYSLALFNAILLRAPSAVIVGGSVSRNMSSKRLGRGLIGLRPCIRSLIPSILSTREYCPLINDLHTGSD